ncbi:MAG: hypothetical protein ACR2FN_13630 [Chitinophagaceae bacterium]
MTNSSAQENTKAKPKKIPRPTYWPFFTAISLMFFGWGLLTIWIICVAGLIGFFISLAGWIKELLYERRNNE